MRSSSSLARTRSWRQFRMRKEVVRRRALLAAVDVHDNCETAGQRHHEPRPRRPVLERAQHGLRSPASDPKASGPNPSARSAKHPGRAPGSSRSGSSSTTGDEEHQRRAITVPHSLQPRTAHFDLPALTSDRHDSVTTCRDRLNATELTPRRSWLPPLT